MEEVARTCREWDYAHGLVMNLETDTSQRVVHAPHMVKASPFPRAAFEEAVALAVPFQHLYRAVARDTAFLTAALERSGDSDDFVRRLLALLREAAAAEGRQSVECAILRSDYMLHGRALKQIEVNTISASFAGLATRVSRLHQHLSRTEGGGGGNGVVASSLPDNRADEGVSEAMAEAFRAYGSASAAVLFLVQDRERNKYDQLHLQYLLQGRFGICVIRATLQDMRRASTDANGRLWLGDKELAVVYFRAGYGPGDYPGEEEWATRRRIELSMAVKIPTVAWQLAGTKKVQQLLADPALLRRYAATPEHAERVARSFVGLFELSEATVARALAEPERFVLKPQREGGGNNWYGDDMVQQLRTLARSTWPAFILMELIVSEPFPNAVLRDDQITSGECLSELGIYSGLVCKADTVLFDRPLGHLLRTKFTSSRESGVSAGFGALDSPRLVAE